MERRVYQAEDNTCKDKRPKRLNLAQKTGISVYAGSGKKGDY